MTEPFLLALWGASRAWQHAAPHLAAEDDEAGADGVGHGGRMVGEHFTQPWRRHVPRLRVARGRHDPVDRLRLLAAVAPRALRQLCSLIRLMPLQRLALQSVVP